MPKPSNPKNQDEITPTPANGSLEITNLSHSPRRVELLARFTTCLLNIGEWSAQLQQALKILVEGCELHSISLVHQTRESAQPLCIATSVAMDRDWNAWNDTQDRAVNIPLLVAGERWGYLRSILSRDGSRDEPGVLQTLEAAVGILASVLERRDQLQRQQQAILAEKQALADARLLDAINLQNLLSGVVAASKALIDVPEFDRSLELWLVRLGRAVGSIRTVLGSYIPDDTGTRMVPIGRIFWAHPDGVATTPPPIPMNRDYEDWTKRLLSGEAVWACRSDLVDPRAHEHWDQYNRGCTAVIPVIVDGHTWGWLYFDFAEERPRDSVLLALLQAAADGAAAAIRRDQAIRNAAQEADARRRAVVEERTRFAREIHDTLAQGLIGILMNARMAAEAIGDRERQLPHLRVIESLASENLAEARRSVHALRPQLTDGLGLQHAFQMLVKQHSNRENCSMELVVQPLLIDLPPVVEDELLRIGQEAVANALKHAKATRIVVKLEPLHASGVQVTVTDNGCGFDPTAVAEGRFGIVSMRERARVIGAELTIATRLLAGTEVRAVWWSKN